MATVLLLWKPQISYYFRFNHFYTSNLQQQVKLSIMRPIQPLCKIKILGQNQVYGEDLRSLTP